MIGNVKMNISLLPENQKKFLRTIKNYIRLYIVTCKPGSIFNDSAFFLVFRRL